MRVGVRVFIEVVLLLEAVVVVVQMLPVEPSNIPLLSAAEVCHTPQRVCAKDDAPANICFMLVTLDTSHLETSLLNDNAE